ncbi:MAG: hypothetical protein HPZ91_13515 [Lentisphaeria bacterium]|nr:hypothetical protein [Lentisphaeria bacterium]
MTLFISAVLAAAAFQSFCKLALLPRRWEFLTALLLIPLPFFFEERIARTSLAALTESLSSAAALENWCALVVIQELFTLMAGFSLLSEYESAERVKPWKYAVFIPSALLPAGALYLQMRLFNEFPNFEFRTITWSLATALPLGGIAVSELTRLLRRDREARILSVLHVEWILILGAVFLPVAANARLIPPAGEENNFESLYVFGVLAIPVILSTIFFTIYLNYKRKKSHVNRHSNS